jgi:hypothetical protein
VLLSLLRLLLLSLSFPAFPSQRRSEKTFESIHPYLDNMHEEIEFSCQTL